MARSLGDRIRRARVDAGLSQPQLARKLNRCTASVHRWETSRVEPSLETLREVARALGVSFAELVTGHAA